MMAAQTMFDKIWAKHVIVPRPGGEELLSVDLNLVRRAGKPAAGLCAEPARLPRDEDSRHGRRFRLRFIARERRLCRA